MKDEQPGYYFTFWIDEPAPEIASEGPFDTFKLASDRRDEMKDDGYSCGVPMWRGKGGPLPESQGVDRTPPVADGPEKKQEVKADV